MHMDKPICCNHKGYTMERFMEVCLFLLLRDGPMHGYGLAEQLIPFGFAPEDLNVSTLYRTLRKMEHEGFVVSDWQEGEQGPRKRVYKITTEGEENLEEWIQVLQYRKARIEKVLAVYKEPNKKSSSKVINEVTT